MAGLERIVLEHPFFAGLGAAFAQAISGCARNMRVAAGDYLFREGEPADEFYLIRQGAMALEIHAPGRQPIIVATLYAGEVLDGSWLCRPIAGRLMRAPSNSPGCSESTPNACARSAKLITTSVTS
jgi:CRP/FNR family cyclic AMP-dependent transcriptional regulator